MLNVKNFSRSKVVLLAALLAPACGSSENTGAPSTPGSDVYVVPDPDTVPPTIVYRVPADGAERVSVRSPIRAAFSERVKLGDNPAVLLANDVPIPTRVVLSEDARVVTISPEAEIPVPAKVSVSLRDITDLRGNPLVRPSWSWAAPAWLEVGDALHDPGGYSFVSIATGPDDRINVALGKMMVSGFEQSVRWIDSPGGWGDYPGYFHYSRSRPSLVIGRGGSPILAYVDESNDSVSVQRKKNDGPWEFISSDFRTRADGNVAFAVDADGLLFLAYDARVSDDETSVKVVTLSRWSGDVWTPLAKTVSEPTIEKGSRLLDFTLDKNGTPYVAYQTALGDARVRAWSGMEWKLVGGPLNRPEEAVGLGGIHIAIDDTANPFALVNFDDRYLARYRTQILRFDGTNWSDCGAEIARTPATDPISLARTRGGHLFAFLSIGPELRTLDVTSAGWTALPPPVAAGPKLVGAAMAITPDGVPVIAWRDHDDVQVARPNR